MTPGPDIDLIDNTASKFLDVGVVGAVCLLLIGALIVLSRYFLKEIDKRDVAHEQTRAMLIEEIRGNAKTTTLVTQQMAAQEKSLEAVMNFIRKEKT